MIFPWLASTWRQLHQSLETRRPQAVLLSGVNGVGQRELAAHVGGWLLCDHPSPQGACGQCVGCTWVAAGTHPDYWVIEPEEGSRTIKVDTIRSRLADAPQTTHRSGLRVIVMGPMEALNVAASNALLKTLEEPTESTLFVLWTAAFARLLPTIISRCQRVRCAVTDESAALAWLVSEVPQLSALEARVLLCLADGGPLAAQEWYAAKGLALRGECMRQLRDLLVSRSWLDSQVCEEWVASHKGGRWLLVWISVLVDIERAYCGVPAAYWTHRDCEPQLRQIVGAWSVDRVRQALSRALEARRVLGVSSGINESLLWESLLNQL
ncbi:MAG: hypothetical protein A3J38_00045 [Gammaproteobacteria bacterium RIFCSPHIGHO2_12_FULL_45_9]|nr:MAG: hypothetical protein A3J38_00045 [Gammaproteobacteria bacterium RIFCSPHIGHO2_12_FULL_45_9]